MVKQGIQIYARAKPSKQKTGLYETYEDENGGSAIAFTVPKDLADGYINNKREVYKFRFNRVFDQECRQDEVFEEVAQGVIDNVLTGYNGTIFAYGQTGSGKTFTITGGAERYVDRGLIPRSLSYIFDYFEKHSEIVFTANISYLEIYNENGYDLLDPKHEASKLEDLPKVTLYEDADSNIHLKNLSLHQANNEEEALNLLFLGDTNRMIAETPMNQASTRSHCIFTVHVSSREPGSATIRRAKLHLVDLAGSERVGKTNVGGTILTEAKYINLSLHYLEQVIVALSDKSRSHIPYRNSMMTSVLRDSLGGNCMTTMIATCSLERKNLDESISTCRFAQRVAMIKNDVILNEELDPKLLITQLKAEVQRLKDEVAMVTGKKYTGELSDEEMDRLRRMVKTFIEDSDPEAVLSVGADMRKINYCFQLLKGHVLERSRKSSSPPSQRNSVLDAAVDSSYLGNHSEVSKLKELIKQRDNEINILYHRFEKRLNWETTGLSSRNALLASATLDCLSDLFKLDEALEFSKGASLEDHRTSTDPAGDATFIGELDREAIVTLGKLSADVDSFTLKELKQIHRRSRVAMEASMTNNLHIHQQIVKLLGNHIVLDSQRNLMLQLERVRKEVMRNYNAALDKCNDSHSRLRNLEKQRLQAEEEYVAAMMELNRMEQQKSKVLTLIETQHVGDGRRKRTTSIENQPKHTQTVSCSPIDILVGMLKKEKKRTEDLEVSVKQGGSRLLDGAGGSERLRRSTSQPVSDDSEGELYHLRPNSAGTRAKKGRPASDTTENREHPQAASEERGRSRPPSAYRRKLDEMSVGRKEAFETFRRDYPDNETIDENKRLLKQRYAEAKALGEQVNSSRQKINTFKSQIEQHRVRRSMQGFVNGTDEPQDVDLVEQNMRQAIEAEKSKYKESFTRLRSLKTEIEHLQHLLEKAKVKMQKDFEIWWAEQGAVNQPPEEVRAAWKTPPISPVRPPSASRKRDPDPGGGMNVPRDEVPRSTRPGKFVSKLRAEAQLVSSGIASVGREDVRTPVYNSNSDSSLRSWSETNAARTKSGSASDVSSGSVKLTGDSRADADIMAFIKARQNLLQQRGHR